MGNKSSRETVNSDQVDSVYNSSANNWIRWQKINPDHNNSLRSFLSVESQQSTYSVSRPWSRVSRRRWRESTLTLPYQSCKTAWPVSQLESFFLPEFPVNDLHQDNNFEKLREIRGGAFGKIYQILDLEKNEIFALKVLSKSKIIENNLTKQVIEEVQIQRACGHNPFIANCPSNWQSRKHLYIAIEYIEGGELWNLLDNFGALPLEIVQLYVAQIALAIDFLHNAGVIYRDLKPENILLDADANIKLIDFGLSKWLPFNHTTRTVCGTPKYMDVDCDFIDLTYVCCSSNSLNRQVKQEISNFSEQLRSNESSGMGQISLEFFQRKPSRYLFLQPECIPWEVWTVRLQLITLENEGERQLCRETVGDHLTDKILYITEVMNRQDYLPKMPSKSEVDLVFDTSFPDVQPYLFKMNYSISGPSSGTSVGTTMRKFIKESLNL